MEDKHPWWAWLILSLAWVFLTVLFWFVFGTMPGVGHWLRWVLGALPTVIVLPFVIAAIRSRK